MGGRKDKVTQTGILKRLTQEDGILLRETRTLLIDLQHHSALASSKQQTLKQESSRASSRQEEFPNNTQTVQERSLSLDLSLTIL